MWFVSRHSSTSQSSPKEGHTAGQEARTKVRCTHPLSESSNDTRTNQAQHCEDWSQSNMNTARPPTHPNRGLIVMPSRGLLAPPECLYQLHISKAKHSHE